MNDRDETFAACARLTAAFAMLVDHQRYDELVELFTEDCQFKRPDVTLSGRGALKDFMNARDPNQLTRHLCSPPAIMAAGDGEARGVTYLTFYHGAPQESGPGKLTGVTAVAEYHDLFRKTANGWLIAERQVVPVMMGS